MAKNWKRTIGDLGATMICILALAVMIGGPILVTVFGYRDIVLNLSPTAKVEAVINSRVEGPNSRIFPKRGGDWTISYTFEHDGKKWSNDDVMPPAIYDPSANTIQVRCSKWQPKISRIDSQVSSTPINALFIVVAVGFVFLRNR